MPIRDIVLTAIVFGLVPVALFRPWIGVLAFAWLGFMNPHKQTWDFARDMPFAMLIGVATLVGLLIARDRKSIPWTPELGLLVAMFLHFTLTTYYAWAPAPAWEQWEKMSKILLMTFVMTMLLYGEKRIRALIWVVALSIGFYGLKGAQFTIRTGGGSMVLGPEGTFIGGNTSLGLAMVMTLPLIIFLARSSSRPWLRRGMNVLAIAQIISTIFTYSRGALLGLAATVPLLFLRSKRKFFLLALLVPLAFFVEDLLPAKLIGRAQTIESYEQDSSAMLRFQAWSVAKNIAKERPLTGAGFNFEYGVPDPLWLSYADFLVEGTENSARAAHSIYFQILGQHGFVGLGLFVLLLVLLLRQLWRVRAAARKRSELEWVVDLAGTLQIALVGYLVSGAFLSLAYFDLLYTYVALAAILRREVAIAETAPVVAGPKVPSAGANIGGPAGAPAAGGSAASGLGSRPEAGR